MPGSAADLAAQPDVTAERRDQAVQRVVAAGVRLGRTGGVRLGHVHELYQDAACFLRLEPIGKRMCHRVPHDRSRLFRPRSRRILVSRPGEISWVSAGIVVNRSAT